VNGPALACIVPASSSAAAGVESWTTYMSGPAVVFEKAAPVSVPVVLLAGMLQVTLRRWASIVWSAWEVTGQNRLGSGRSGSRSQRSRSGGAAPGQSQDR
jgi:hypothetical protein